MTLKKTLRKSKRALSSQFLKRTALSLAVLTAIHTNAALANPNGAEVVSGQVGITQIPNLTTITNSPGAIINWQNFSIAQGEVTRFIQQSSQSAVLNRVIGQNPSEIMGSLISNGHVFLINPNGVLFGSGAMIDTQSMIASTLNISNNDFQSGNYHFIAGSGAGNILNEGIIRTGKDGNIVLIAPNIENNGIIQTDGGTITLAAGNELTLTSLDNPDIRFQVQSPDNEVLNLGQVLTEGGAINLFAGTITHSGELNANSMTLDAQGNIVLSAQQDITLTDTSFTSVNNSVGVAGDIKIEAEHTTVQANAVIEATGQTRGGDIRVLASDTLTVKGTLTANGGDGFIETSAPNIDINDADVSAVGGEWLIDPTNITIEATTCTGTNCIAANTISTTLSTDTSVTISTDAAGIDDGNITVNGAITKSSGNGITSLTLNAHNDITVNANITASSGILNVNLNSDTDSLNGGSSSLTSGNTIDTFGGQLAISGGDLTVSSGTIVDATVVAASTESITFSGSSTLDGVDLGVNATVANTSSIHIYNDLLLLDGTTLNIGDASTYGSAYIRDLGEIGTVSGSADIVFGSHTSNIITGYSGGSYTVGASTTISGENGSISFIENQGTINANVSGGYLQLSYGGNGWTNSGSLIASNGGTLNISGTIASGGLGSYTIDTGGAIILPGTLYNTGYTQDLSGIDIRGTIIGGQVDNANSFTSTTSLDGVTLGTDTTFASNRRFQIYNDLQLLDGVTLTVGDASTYGQVYMYDAGTIRAASGSADILFGSDAGNIISGYSSGTYTVDASTTISGENGTVSLIDNQGVINSSSGGTLTVTGSNWINNGTLTSSNGGTLSLAGTMANTGLTQDLTGVTVNGSVIGGQINNAILGTSHLHGVTLGDGNTITNNKTVYIYNDLYLLSGATLNVGDASTYGRIETMDQGTIDAVSGSANIIFGSSISNHIQPNGVGDSLTIGSGITISGERGGVGRAIYGFSNLGTIHANVSGGAIGVRGDSWTNSGTLMASNGAALQLQGLDVNDGTLNFASGTTVSTINKDLINNGTIEGSGTLNLGSTAYTLTNNGIVAPGDTVGTLSITGNYIQNATGDLNLQLQGTGSGQFDLLAISGTATFEGNINLDLLAPYDGTAQVGDNYDLITATSITDNGLSLLDTTGATFAHTNQTGVFNASISDWLYTWTGPTSGTALWNDAANWGGQAPTSGRDVLIADQAGTLDITYSSGSLSLNTLTSYENLTITGGTLTLGNEIGDVSTFAVGTDLKINGGTLNSTGAVNINSLIFNSGIIDGAGAITISDTFNWAGGTVSGSGLFNVEGVLAIYGATNSTSNKPILDGRTLTHSNSSGNSVINASALNTQPLSGDEDQFNMNNGATFINAVGAVLEIKSPSSGTFFIDQDSGANTTFSNLGTINKTGAGDLDIGGFGVVSFSNDGEFNILQGTVNLRDNSTHTGVFNISSGALFNLMAGTHDFNASSSILGTGQLSIAGTLNTAGTIDISHLTLDGTLGGTGTINITDTFNWNIHGIIENATNFTTSNTATSTLDSTIYLDSSAWSNYGVVNWDGLTNSAVYDYFYLDGNAVLNNFGTFNDNTTTATANTVAYIGTGGHTAAVINNSGTWNKTGTGPKTLTRGTSFNNTGTVNVSSGTLEVATASSNTGSFTVDVGATLSLQGATTIGVGEDFYGTGNVIFGSNVSFSDSVNLYEGQSYTFRAPPSPLTGSSLDTFPSNGLITDNGNGTLTYTPTSGYTGTDSFDYTHLDTPGLGSASGTLTFNILATPTSYTWDGPTSGTAQWDDAANWGGLVPVAGSDVTIPFLGGNLDIIYSAGSLNLNTLISNESLTITGGALSLGDELFDVSTFASSTTFSLSGGSFGGAGAIGVLGDFAWSGGSLDGTGTLSLINATGISFTDTVTQNGMQVNMLNAVLPTGTTFNLNGGIFNTTGSTAGLMSGSTFNFSGGTVSTQSASYNVDGAINWSGGNFDVAGDYNLSSTGVLNITGSNTLSAIFFNNQGTLTKSSSGTSSILLGDGFFGFFNNTGTVSVNNGTLSILPGTGSGSIAFSYQQAAGLTTLNGGTLVVENMSLSGGQLTGAGTISAVNGVTNNAVIAPGFSPGILTIDGDYIQGSTGTLNMEMAGTAPGQFDQINVTGTATLDGTLNITPLGAYDGSATVGDNFDLITATGGMSGSFANVTSVSGYSYITSVSAGVFNIDTTATPSTPPPVVSPPPTTTPTSPTVVEVVATPIEPSSSAPTSPAVEEVVDVVADVQTSDIITLAEQTVLSDSIDVMGDSAVEPEPVADTASSTTQEPADESEESTDDSEEEEPLADIILNQDNSEDEVAGSIQQCQ